MLPTPGGAGRRRWSRVGCLSLATLRPSIPASTGRRMFWRNPAAEPCLSSSPSHTGLDEVRQAPASAAAEAHLGALLPTPRKLGGTDRVALNAS
jgi:hypothetical protein